MIPTLLQAFRFRLYRSHKVHKKRGHIPYTFIEARPKAVTKAKGMPTL